MPLFFNSSNSGGSGIQTFPVPMINQTNFNLGTSTATWGGLIMTSSQAYVNSISCYVYTAATGTVTGGIYDATTNALIASTSTASTAASGIVTASFSSTVSINGNYPYYLALVCSTTVARFCGCNLPTATFTLSPKPSFIQTGSQLPATLTPTQTASLIWLCANS